MEHTDCTSCKLISGCGFLGFGLYVGLTGSQNSAGPYSRLAIMLIGLGLSGIGLARLCDLPPFKKSNRNKEQT